MGLILRRNLSRPLTHDELDNDLVYLDINEWVLQGYEKGMWCYIKGVDDIMALYLCETTHNKAVYPSGVFAEVVNTVRLWRPFNGGGGGSVYFQNPAPSTASNLEGVPAGTTFPTPTSMQDMWDMLLYPYQQPAFTLFMFLTHSGMLEIGESFTTDTASWTTSQSANVSPNSVHISGDDLTPVTGLDANGTTPLTFDNPVTRTTKGGKTWVIGGTTTRSMPFSTNLSIYWEWMFYWGTSLNTSLTENEIEALANHNLQSSIAGTYNFGNTGYKYFCYADDYGEPTKFFDVDTGFQVAMYGGYPNVDSKGFSYDLVSVTNTATIPQTINYRVYRTKNILNDVLNMQVY